MRRKKDKANKRTKFEKSKIDKHLKKHPNGGVKQCLRCESDFLSTDVCNNRICVDCSRLISKEWIPNAYKSGLNSSTEPDDWF